MGSLRRLKSLPELLRNSELNNYNLHRIAISNLADHERRVARWWSKKYKSPLKSFHDHTMEELMVEMLEDYYEQHPAEIERFYYTEQTLSEVGWDGTMPKDYEREIQARLKKINSKNRVDVSKYATPEEQITEEDEQRILDSLGRDLPKSRSLTKKNGGVEAPTMLGEEFEDSF